MILKLAIALILGYSSESNPLDKFMWENRILLFYGNEKAASEYDYFKNYSEEVEERDMILIWTDGQEVKSTLPNSISSDEISKVVQYLELERYEKIILLIGKDGNIKKKYNLVIPQYVFDLIDSMPMRKNEMIKNTTEILINH